MSDILKIISDVFKKLSDISGAFLGENTLKKGKIFFGIYG
jgi:hypothetical protein